MRRGEKESVSLRPGSRDFKPPPFGLTSFLGLAKFTMIRYVQSEAADPMEALSRRKRAQAPRLGERGEKHLEGLKSCMGRVL